MRESDLKLDIKRALCYISCIFTIYFYLYAPAFQAFPIGTDKPILVLSLIYLTYKQRWTELFLRFKIEWLILLAVFGVSLFVSYIHCKKTVLLLYDFLLLIEVFPCSYALYLFFQKGFSIRLDKVILICAICAAFISVFLLLNPEYTYYIKSELLKYPEDLVDKFLFRGYGISDGLLFSYPVIQGFCTALILLGLGVNNSYYIFLIPLFLSIVANARSGFIPVLIAIIFFLIQRPRTFFKILFLVSLLLIFTFNILSTFIESNKMIEESLNWGMTSFNILGDFFSGKQAENFDSLLGDMVVWPASIDEWLIGSGRFLFGAPVRGTDIGYFIRLNYGGIIYILLWFILCIYMFYRLFPVNKVLTCLLFISLTYLNYKSDFFIVNPASRFFFFIYAICILDQKNFTRLN